MATKTKKPKRVAWYQHLPADKAKYTHQSTGIGIGLGLGMAGVGALGYAASKDPFLMKVLVERSYLLPSILATPAIPAAMGGVIGKHFKKSTASKRDTMSPTQINQKYHFNQKIMIPAGAILGAALAAKYVPILRSDVAQYSDIGWMAKYMSTNKGMALGGLVGGLGAEKALYTNRSGQVAHHGRKNYKAAITAENTDPSVLSKASDNIPMGIVGAASGAAIGSGIAGLYQGARQARGFLPSSLTMSRAALGGAILGAGVVAYHGNANPYMRKFRK